MLPFSTMFSNNTSFVTYMVFDPILKRVWENNKFKVVVPVGASG
jgi:hypothetical protein